MRQLRAAGRPRELRQWWGRLRRDPMQIRVGRRGRPLQMRQGGRRRPGRGFACEQQVGRERRRLQGRIAVRGRRSREQQVGREQRAGAGRGWSGEQVRVEEC